MIVDSDALGCLCRQLGFDLHQRADPVPATMVRVDPDGTVTAATEDLQFPNGTVITPDGSTLIVGESFGARLTAFDVAADGALSNRRVWAQLDGGPRRHLPRRRRRDLGGVADEQRGAAVRGWEVADRARDKRQRRLHARRRRPAHAVRVHVTMIWPIGAAASAVAHRVRPRRRAGRGSAVTIDNDEDLEGLKRAGRVVAEAREAMVAAVAPGVTTGDLDAIGREVFRRHGARSAPRDVQLPGSTCISVNDEAAHGIPSKTRHLRAGDIVNLDVSAELDGYFSDTGISTAVGVVSPVAARLLDATRLAQQDAMGAARAGRQLREVGRAVEARARREGFSVIRNLFGRGIGRGLLVAVGAGIGEAAGASTREGMVMRRGPSVHLADTSSKPIRRVGAAP